MAPRLPYEPAWLRQEPGRGPGSGLGLAGGGRHNLFGPKTDFGLNCFCEKAFPRRNVSAKCFSWEKLFDEQMHCFSEQISPFIVTENERLCTFARTA